MTKSTTEIIVRGYHLDGYQHVNNARYLEFLEEDRWQYFDNISGKAYSEMGVAFVVVNININYRFPATFGDVLHVKTSADEIGNSSMSLNQVIYLADSKKTVCDAKIKFVMLDQKTGRPARIQGELKSLLLKEISK